MGGIRLLDFGTSHTTGVRRCGRGAGGGWRTDTHRIGTGHRTQSNTRANIPDLRRQEAKQFSDES